AHEVVIESLSLGNGRHALWAHTPISDSPSADRPSFGALIAAVPSGTREARVLYAGSVGFSKGEPGERYGDYLEVTQPDAEGTVHVLLGEVREDVTICGRRSLLSPMVLDARDLAFKSARLQRLSRDERERAPTLTAEASTTPEPQGIGRVLQG